MQPGVYSNDQLSSDAYHASEGISKSGLDEIAQSPLHYWERYLNPDREIKAPTPALIVGQAFHTLIGEPEKFSNQFALAPSKADYPQAVATIEDITERAASLGISLPKGKKDAMFAALKASDDQAVLWDDLKEQIVAGKTILSVDQWDKIHRMSDAVAKHPAARVLLQGGAFEQSHYWRHIDADALCKCRPDYIRSDGVIVDFKTAEDASEDAFKRAAWNFGYHRQAAFYLDGLAATVNTPGPFVFLVIEKEPPYAVAVYEADQEMILAGRIQYMRALQAYSECRKANQWPGYPKTIQPLGIPFWAKKELFL